jgi:hypothetical protein
LIALEWSALMRMPGILEAPRISELMQPEYRVAPFGDNGSAVHFPLQRPLRRCYVNFD